MVVKLASMDHQISKGDSISLTINAANIYSPERLSVSVNEVYEFHVIRRRNGLTGLSKQMQMGSLIGLQVLQDFG